LIAAGWAAAGCAGAATAGWTAGWTAAGCAGAATGFVITGSTGLSAEPASTSPPLAWPAPILLFSLVSLNSCLANLLRGELRLTAPRPFLRAIFLAPERRLLFLTTRRTTFFGLRAKAGLTLRVFALVDLEELRERATVFFLFAIAAPLVDFF